MIVATINKKLLVHFDTKRLFKAQKSSKQVSIWNLRDDITLMWEGQRERVERGRGAGIMK